MKKLLLAILPLIAASYSYSQSTFPTDGSNVGIGTIKPASKLEIKASVGSSPLLRLYNSDAADGRASIIFGSDKLPLQQWELGQNAGGGNKYFGIRDITASGFPVRFLVNTDGNIGIGTYTPQASLDVNNNSIIGTGAGKLVTALTLVKNGDANGTDYSTLLIKHSGVGSNQFTNSATDVGVIRIQGFNASVANKAINSNDNFYVFTNGTVGVNTNYVPSGFNLAVNGSAIATSITVMVRSAWPDYIFNPSYHALNLSEVKAYIDKNHHLPEIPSAPEVAKNGINLGEMNTKLLKKIEELTLYLIELKQDNEELSNRIGKLENKN